MEDRGFSNDAAGEGFPHAESPPEQGFGDLRPYVPEDILNTRFPVSVRGYDRGAVDAYRKRVNRVIAEMKVSGSPRAAVRHALEQAGQQVHGLLQSARETAEEITASARREAEESTARAKAEAAELVVNASAEADRVRAEANEFTANARTEAEALVAKARADSEGIRASAKTDAANITERSRMEASERLEQLEEELASLRDQAERRMSEIQADTKSVWEERQRLLDDIRGVSAGLGDLAGAAAARLPRLEQAEPNEEASPAESEDGTASADFGDDQSTRAATAVVAAAAGSEDQDGDGSPLVSPGR